MIVVWKFPLTFFLLRLTDKLWKFDQYSLSVMLHNTKVFIHQLQRCRALIWAFHSDVNFFIIVLSLGVELKRQSYKFSSEWKMRIVLLHLSLQVCGFKPSTRKTLLQCFSALIFSPNFELLQTIRKWNHRNDFDMRRNMISILKMVCLVCWPMTATNCKSESCLTICSRKIFPCWIFSY